MADITFVFSGTSNTRDLTEINTVNGQGASVTTPVKYSDSSLDLTGDPFGYAFFGGSFLSDSGSRITGWIRWNAQTVANDLLDIRQSGSPGSMVLMLSRTSGGKLRLYDGNASTFKEGSATFAADTWYRIAISYKITSTTDWDCNVYYATADGVAGTLDISAGDADWTLTLTSTAHFMFRSITSTAVERHYYSPWIADNGTDLADPGDIRVTPKLLNTESGGTQAFDTIITNTGRTRGSTDYNQVNERALSTLEGWRHAAVTEAAETYGIQNAATGDNDITGKAVLAHYAWCYASRGANTPATFRSATSDTGNTTTGGTFAIPSDVIAGDALYVFVTSQGSTSGSSDVTCTDDDSGGNTWLVVTNTSDKKAWVFWKRATSATASKTITIANGVTKTAMGVVVVKDARTGGATNNDNPPHTNITTETNASGDETHAGFTPDIGASLIMFSVHDYGSNNDATTQSTANLGAMTERISHLPGGAGADCAVSAATLDGTDAAAADTGSITWAQTNSTTYSIAFAVRPEVWSVTGKLVRNGSDVNITLTTTNSYFSAISNSATYPSGVFGMKSAPTTGDTNFYEGGADVVYNQASNDGMDWMGRLPTEHSRSPQWTAY